MESHFSFLILNFNSQSECRPKHVGDAGGDEKHPHVRIARRADERPADGTATRGACEYSATGAADIPAAPAELLEDCRIVDLAGRTIAVLGTVSRTEAMAYSGLQPGIYILCWRGGAAKIRY